MHISTCTTLHVWQPSAAVAYNQVLLVALAV
jgi:hypothetical protein